MNNEIIYKEYTFKARSFDEEKRTVWARISDNKEDSDGDIMYQDGVDLEKFMSDDGEGGPLLSFHNTHKWAIGKGVDYEQTKAFIDMQFRFFPEKENPDSEIAMYQVKNNVTKAFSVGFKILEYDVIDGVRHIKLWELYEVSLVRKGANARALAKFLKEQKNKLTSEQNIYTIDNMKDSEKSNELETLNKSLQKQLAEAHTQIAEKNKEIEDLQKQVDAKEVEISPELQKQVVDKAMEQIKKELE